MRLFQRFNTIPFHIAGVICFFLIHGYSENIGLIPFWDLLFFFIIHLLVAVLFFGLFMWRLRSATKAGLLTTFLFFFYLFYGAIADFFKGVSFLSWLSHYRYLLGAFILGMLLLFRYCKRSAGSFQRVTLYLNSVFIFLILYDLVYIAFHRTNNGLPEQNGSIIKIMEGHFEKKPDIYFVLLDEYSGTNMMKTYYNYDNHPFENFLRQQGFFVASTPACNYQATVLSMASMFSMDYLKWLPEEGKGKETAADNAQAYKVIANSEVISFLHANGYDPYNYSCFEIGNQPSFFNVELLSVKSKLITGKTLAGCIEKDLLWNWRNRGQDGNWLSRRVEDQIRVTNKRIFDSTMAVPAYNTAHPKFVYAHLFMPHEPFLYDSTGGEVHINAFNRLVPIQVRKNAYLQYFVYTNKVITAFIRELLQKTMVRLLLY